MGGEQQLDYFTLQMEALLNNVYCQLVTRWHYCWATQTQSHPFSLFPWTAVGLNLCDKLGSWQNKESLQTQEALSDRCWNLYLGAAAELIATD